MATELRALFSPIQVGRLTLKNRIYSSGHAEAMAEGGRPGERLRRGGAALPRRRPRRDRDLDGAQPSDRSVLVTPVQPAARRLRWEPREPDALRHRSADRDPASGRG